MAQLSTEFRRLTQGINDAIERGVDRYAREVERTARTKHRYRSRTGNLMRATKMARETVPNEARVIIDEAMAPYGEYIHDGFRGWAPDRFLENAGSEQEMAVRVEQEIDKTTRALGWS